MLNYLVIDLRNIFGCLADGMNSDMHLVRTWPGYNQDIQLHYKEKKCLIQMCLHLMGNRGTKCKGFPQLLPILPIKDHNLSISLVSDTCCNNDEPQGHHAKWNKPITKEQLLYYFIYEVSKVLKFIATESKKVVTKSRGEEWEGNSLLGHWVSVL